MTAVATVVEAPARRRRVPATFGGVPWSRWVLRVLVLGWLSFLLLVPLGSILWRVVSAGPSAVWTSITSPDAVHAIVLTLIVAAIVVPMNAVFGVGVAIILARHRFPGAWLLGAIVDLPLAVSPIIVGVSLLLVYGRNGWLGQPLLDHGIQILFSLPGIVLASAFVSLPYTAREVLPVLLEIGTEQEQAASTLGAGPFAIFRRVTLPSIRYGLAYGITLTTARVLGEFGAVSIVSGNIEGHTQTLTLFVSDQLENFDPTAAYTGALVLCLISVFVLAVLRFSRAREVSRSWPSKSDQSQNVSETQSPSTTSTS